MASGLSPFSASIKGIRCATACFITRADLTTWGRNILPELKGLIDFVSVSLNAESSEVYDKICHSFYGQKAYPAVVEFIKEAKKYIPDVEASIVDMPTVDKEKCASIAADLGVKFRVRPYYEERYVR